MTGKLNGIIFARGWCYWVATGKVPIAIARELYKNPIGKEAVRVDGHCGCPPPDEWAMWIWADGRQVLPNREKSAFERLVQQGIIKERELFNYVFADNPATIGAEAFVTNYHIDTEEGLRLFADALNGSLVPQPS